MWKIVLFIFSGFIFSCKAQPEYQPFVVSESITISELHRGYMDKKYRVEDVVSAYLDRIQKIDDAGPELNAVIVTNPDALSIAGDLDAELQKGKSRGLLHGIPVLLKDNISTRDSMATTAGSRALSGDITGKDSEVARQLREAGAVIIGKANLSEWANFRGPKSTSGWSAVGGQTKNPYVLDRNPCGSSSGSGVAVSANLVPLAIGTETDGSIVCPAHANGIVGLKPTVGLVSRTGIVPISYSQDIAGPMAKTVEEVAIALSAITDKDPRDEKTMQDRLVPEDYTSFLNDLRLDGKRIGYLEGIEDVDPAVNALYKAAIEKMKELGARLVLIDPTLSEEINKAEFNILLMEYEDGLNNYFKDFSNSSIHRLEDVIEFNKNDSVEMAFYGQEFLEMALEQPDMDSKEYRKNLEIIEEKARKNGFDRILSEHKLDAVIAPTGLAAWKTNWETGDQFEYGSSSTAAITGYPNITLPMGFDGALPIGLSVFGGKWQEGKLLQIAHAYEQAAKHRKEPEFLSH